ncbi:MAG: glucose 1-dehydrogenase [Sterolibacterium sp.]|nr:glucose 1-dehydrogenase [Sterolibacterium sp.]
MNIGQQFSLQDQVAIITGAGRGIGRAIALAYAEAGAKVVCAARSLDAVTAVAEQARQFGGQALAVTCDVNDEAQLDQLVARTLQEFGRINLLVNNAGGAGPNDPLQTTAEDFNAVLHFNVTTAYVLSSKCAPHMRQAGDGAIINISSSASRYAQKHFSAYGSAKAALNQMTRLLAADFAPQIRVNAIAPGAILTDALAPFLDEEASEKMIGLTPLKRMGMPNDIAMAALYLAAPAARWITGKILEVDGGAESSTWPY